MKPLAGLLALFSLVVVGGILGLVVIRNDLRKSYRPMLGLTSEKSDRPGTKTADRFVSEPANIWQAPALERLMIPEFPDAHTIWGSLGLDAEGRVWFGVSAAPTPTASAHLFCCDPETKWIEDRGDALTQLSLAGKLRARETQMKIHSRIVHAADGYLYFTSMDERGEHVDGSKLPEWGSHLWRIQPSGGQWEHLATVPEGLIAIAGRGRFIFALGYFGHVVYRYDTVAQTLTSTRVGSAGGHISRNLLCDANEHVYVPRVTQSDENQDKKKGPQLDVELVELDSNLKELAATPILNYGATLNDQSHGIVAFVELADRSLIFATHRGALYQIVPGTDGAATIRDLGWFHPDGTAYTPSLFTFSGTRYVMGIARKPGKNFDWLVYDLEQKKSRAFPLRVDHLAQSGTEGLSLFGSSVRDAQGNFYLGGTIGRNPPSPLLVRARYDASPQVQGRANETGDKPLADQSPIVSATKQDSEPPSTDLLLKGTGQDWRAAAESDRRECARRIADWLHGFEQPAAKNAWADRYYEQIDRLARESEGQTGRILDWLPVIHGLLSTEK